jgi:hypothetical protein
VFAISSVKKLERVRPQQEHEEREEEERIPSVSMRCGRLQMIPPLGGGERAGITRFAMQQLLKISVGGDKLQFLNQWVRKANRYSEPIQTYT